MDVLYPRGKTLRFVVNLLFRLLHPTWWPFSLLHWVRATTANYYARARAAEAPGGVRGAVGGALGRATALLRRLLLGGGGGGGGGEGDGRAAAASDDAGPLLPPPSRRPVTRPAAVDTGRRAAGDAAAGGAATPLLQSAEVSAEQQAAGSDGVGSGGGVIGGLFGLAGRFAGWLVGFGAGTLVTVDEARAAKKES